MKSTSSNYLIRLGAPLLAALALTGVSSATTAQTAKPEKIALVSAVGSQFNFSREARTVGSNIVDPTRRYNFKVPSNALDMAVLRGLDEALDITTPGAEREFVVLRLPDDAERNGSDREKQSFTGMIEQLRSYPGRASWDKIIAVIPAYQFTTGKSMGSKLHGVGVYVQPLQAGRVDIQNGLDGAGATISSEAKDGDDATYSPDGERTRSSVFVAPYVYTRTITLDAKTMAVLKDERNLSYRKLFDPNSTALDVQFQFSHEQLADQVVKFVERAARESVAGKGTVILRDPKLADEKK